MAHSLDCECVRTNLIDRLKRDKILFALSVLINECCLKWPWPLFKGAQQTMWFDTSVRSLITLFCVFNFTFAKWVHNPRQCYKVSIVITLFTVVFVLQKTKRKLSSLVLSPQFLLISKHLSLFVASIFYAKCSVVFVACFSTHSSHSSAHGA